MRKSHKYTKDILEPIVKKNISYSGVCRDLNVNQNGGVHRLITGWIKYYNLDTSHFTGQAHNKGKTVETSESVRKTTNKISLKDEEVFITNSRPINRFRPY